jgi:hypothetical protein
MSCIVSMLLQNRLVYRISRREAINKPTQSRIIALLYQNLPILDLEFKFWLSVRIKFMEGGADFNPLLPCSCRLVVAGVSYNLTAERL